MGHDERREILERLEALERMMHSHRGDWDDRDDDCDRRHCDHEHGRHGRRRHGGEEDFQEKRIIDTIVRLVGEHVGRMLDEHAKDRHTDGGGEKRIVDLIVGLVSEHVQEIVATELDRRLGRPTSAGADDERPSPTGGGPREPGPR